MTPITKQELVARMREKARRFHAREPLPETSVSATLPVARYVAPEFFDLEKQFLWSRTWLYCAHVDELPSAGSILRWDNAGPSIILVRGADDVVRAFYNVCPHRGSALVLENAAAAPARSITCPYHSWSYDLDGSLKRVPGEHYFGGSVCREGHRLRDIRCERWGNLIFVNFDRSAAPLSEFLAPLDRLPEVPEKMRTSRFVAKTQELVAANWKAVVDAFLEIYHGPTVHGATIFAQLQPGSTTHVPVDGGHSGMYQMMRENLQEALADSLRPQLSDQPTIDNLNIFPNVATSSNGAIIGFIIAWPRSVGSTVFERVWLSTDGPMDPRDPVVATMIETFNVLTDEDVVILRQQYQALCTGALETVRIGEDEANILHLHRHIDRSIGLDRLSARFRCDTGPHAETPASTTQHAIP